MESVDRPRLDVGSTLAMYTCGDAAGKKTRVSQRKQQLPLSQYLSKVKENRSANRFYDLQRTHTDTHVPFGFIRTRISLTENLGYTCRSTSRPLAQNSNTSVSLTHACGEVQGSSLVLFLHPSFRHRAVVELFEGAEGGGGGGVGGVWGGARL